MRTITTTPKGLSAFTIIAMVFIDVTPLSAAANTSLVDTCVVNDSNGQIITPNDALGPFYVADTPWRTRLAPEAQLNNTDLKLTISGTVWGNNCVPLRNILVEPWYAGLADEDGNQYSPPDSPGFPYRGQVLTDECGRFEVVATFPEVYASRPIRHVHFRFSSVRSLTAANTRESIPTEVIVTEANSTDSNQTSIRTNSSKSSSTDLVDYSTLVRDTLVLTTQMYFEGYIVNGFSPHSSQIAALFNDTDGSKFATWEVRLNVPGNSVLSCTDMPQNLSSSDPADIFPDYTNSNDQGQGGMLTEPEEDDANENDANENDANENNANENESIAAAASSSHSMVAMGRRMLPGMLVSMMGTATVSMM
jgi:protocatechuate 3,4-dioxygenase beta subunit